MISLTPTKLRDYLCCPQMYKLKHVVRVGAAVETSPALAFGRSIHAVLEELHRPGGPSSYTPDFERLLSRCWEDASYNDERESEYQFARACEALKRYVKAYVGAPGETLGTEVNLPRFGRHEVYAA